MGCGLENIKRLLTVLGNPQDRVPVIHVAGTNGKGSVCAYISTILQAAGYTVGVFTSPHLLRVNERVAINQEPISDDGFAEGLTRVVRAFDKINIGDPVFFEILTVMAYDYFAERQVDIAVIETGIGGRLDTTNAVARPILSVITAIGYDHMEILGSTLDQIANEKAGIIKRDCPVVIFPTETHSIFEKAARLKNARLYNGCGTTLYDAAYTLNGSSFSVKTAYFAYQSLTIHLLGLHQPQNAAHAILSIYALREAGYDIPDAAIFTGLEQTHWPGRFDVLPGEPLVVLDGAHNEDGARCFSASLDYYFPHKKIVLVAGILKSKDSRRIMHHLVGERDTLICTQPTHENALPAYELATGINHSNRPPVVEACVKTALQAAKEAAGSDGVVAVAGSLYLIADIMEMR